MSIACNVNMDSSFNGRIDLYCCEACLSIVSLIVLRMLGSIHTVCICVSAKIGSIVFYGALYHERQHTLKEIMVEANADAYCEWIPNG